jgi:hypothetical protein
VRIFTLAVKIFTFAILLSLPAAAQEISPTPNNAGILQTRATQTNVAVMTDAQRIEILTLQNQRHQQVEKMLQLQIDTLAGELKAQGTFSSESVNLTQLQGQIEQRTQAIPYDKEKFTLDLDTATLKPIAKPAPPSEGSNVSKGK